jgi:hypothetical protein
LMILLPVMFLQIPGLEFALPLALVPVVNLTMVVREAIAGVFHWPQIALSLLISLGLIGVSLRLSVRILAFEDVVIGSFGGSFSTFLKQRLLARPRAAQGAGEVAR